MSTICECHSNVAAFTLRIVALPYLGCPKPPVISKALCALCMPRELRQLSEKFGAMLECALEQKLQNADLRAQS